MIVKESNHIGGIRKMKKVSILTAFVALMVSLMAFGAQAALPVTLENVEVNGRDLSGATTTIKDFQRGNELEIEIELSSDVDINDVELEAEIKGFEHNKRFTLSDTTSLFDMDANVSYKKTLRIDVSDLVEEDVYDLIITASTRRDDFREKFSIRFDVERHSVMIDDVVFTPGKVVRAGTTLISEVRLDNNGERDQEDVKVTVSIPELGVSASDYLDEIESDDQESSEEMYLTIAPCTPAGTYEAVVEVRFNDGLDTTSESYEINIVEGYACAAAPVAPVQPGSEDKTVVTVLAQAKEMQQGRGAAYPITITNAGTTAKNYVISVSGYEDWADLTMESNVITLAAGESRTIQPYLAAKDNAEAGVKAFAVKMSVNGQVVKEFPLTATVTEAEAESTSIENLLGVGLVVLVIILAILGIIIGISKMRRSKDDEDEESETYY